MIKSVALDWAARVKIDRSLEGQSRNTYRDKIVTLEEQRGLILKAMENQDK